MTAVASRRRRVRARVEGVVQGVGFRPHVHRLACELGVGGRVWNDARGVVVEAEADAASLAAFLERIAAQAPPLARVERVLVAEELEPTGAAARFAIVASPQGEAPDALVAPDAATCEACLAELFDPADRRFRYPFVNCTNCGPRFTIVRGVPYDRPLTTMAGFAMCDACRAEYEDPADRRFHAQPNACPACGPRVRLLGPGGRTLPLGDARDAVAAAARALLAGAIVAVKGIGGYHLACRADDERAVARLRARKRREFKPFALMAGSLDAAGALVELGDAERTLLTGPERPIVLAPRRADARVAEAVAPHARELGVMLPYAPLHHLLLADAGTPLVLTSGNVSDEPIAYRDDDALERLAPIADLMLLHDRPIATRTDDSVVRAVAGRPLTLRRSRGLAPSSTPLPLATPRPLLACGAELKSTFCVARGARAWVSHHVGDLESWETLRSFTEGIAHFERLFAVTPEVVVHDLHPEHLSTKHALALAAADAAVELLGVQHHHAHLAACLAEHGETGPALGAIFDGAGLGSDGAIWGGELLLGELADSVRVGALRAVPLPGGDAAVRQPWRMACAWLLATSGAPAATPPLPRALAGRVAPDAWAAVAQLARAGVASPATTSVGRLFDAVAALCGICPEIAYEGQAAIELEAACDPFARGAYPLPLDDAGGFTTLDARATVAAVAADLARGVPVGAVAARFHAGLAAATAEACAHAAARGGVGTVILSGGVFQNRRLLERTAALLRERGLRVLVPERLPPGDGGISYGQAAVAAARLAARAAPPPAAPAATRAAPSPAAPAATRAAPSPAAPAAAPPTAAARGR
ncbi:MAG: carbamoyltransferase HypF [Actinobacteria bacterium]|nr:carbamoyltransferase HypF [Actinomycetota bacterium]